MSQKYSFRDPITGELKAWGFIKTNRPGEIRQEEAENFNLDMMSGKRWRWDGSQWVPYTPPVFISLLAEALDTAISAPSLATIRQVLQEWRKQVQ